MKRKAEGEVYECDACGVTRLAEGGELPDGFHGTVKMVMDGWTPDDIDGEWYACRKGHVGKALLNVINGVRGGAL